MCHRLFRRGAGLCVLAVVAQAALDAAPPSEAQTLPMPQEASELRPRRFKGPVRLALTALLISPCKTGGKPWDPGPAPSSDIVEGSKQGLSSELTHLLFKTLRAGSPPFALLARALPWTINAFVGGSTAPDIEATILIDSVVVKTVALVHNSYLPTWAGQATAPVRLTTLSHVEIKVTDADLLTADDNVGVCTFRGTPYVDDQDYALPSSLRCEGHVWSIALRILPTERQAGDEPDDEPGEPRSPAVPSEPPPTQPAAVSYGQPPASIPEPVQPAATQAAHPAAPGAYPAAIDVSPPPPPVYVIPAPGGYPVRRVPAPAIRYWPPPQPYYPQRPHFAPGPHYAPPYGHRPSAGGLPPGAPPP